MKDVITAKADIIVLKELSWVPLHLEITPCIELFPDVEKFWPKSTTEESEKILDVK